jgi:hypothetical protein
MWFMSAGLRSCHIFVYEDGCTLQMRANGEVVLMKEGLSFTEAFELAESLRAAHGQPQPRGNVVPFESRPAAA